MELNDDKCHRMIVGHTKSVTTSKSGNAEIKESYHEKLLGITFDKKLNSTLKIYVKKPTRSSTHLLEYLISWTQLK